MNCENINHNVIFKFGFDEQLWLFHDINQLLSCVSAVRLLF